MPALCPEIRINRLTRVLGQLEHHGTTGLLLPYRRAGNGMALWRDVGDAQANQVTASQLAVDPEIE
jgi:hypothetical protein